MLSLTLVGAPLLLGAVLWFLLDRHEQRRAAAGLPRHSGLRLIFAAAGLLLFLFAGGCSLLFAMNIQTTGERYVTWEAITVLGGPPFLVGLLVWWLAMRRKAG